MSMDGYFKLLGFLLTLLGLAVLLRQKAGVIAIAFTFGVCILCMTMILPQFRALWNELEAMIRLCGIDAELFVPLLKVVGISVCARITAELCRDAGEKAFGVQVELAGAVAALLCAMPLAKRVLELITGAVS